MSRIVISILNLYKSAVSWRGSCDLTHHYRLQAQRLWWNTQWFHQSVSLEEILTVRLQAAERRHRGISSVSLLQLQFYQNWEMYFSGEEGWRPGTEGFSWWRTCPCVSLGFSISLNPSQASLLVALTCCSSYWLKFAFYESAALFQTVSTGGQ